MLLPNGVDLAHVEFRTAARNTRDRAPAADLSGTMWLARPTLPLDYAPNEITEAKTQ